LNLHEMEKGRNGRKVLLVFDESRSGIARQRRVFGITFSGRLHASGGRK
jgi:hypothetical protein